jgi:hypothetical protein
VYLPFKKKRNMSEIKEIEETKSDISKTSFSEQDVIPILQLTCITIQMYTDRNSSPLLTGMQFVRGTPTIYPWKDDLPTDSKQTP